MELIGKNTTYRNRWLGCLPKQAITNWKLEPESPELIRVGVPIKGSGSPSLADMLEISAIVAHLRIQP